MSLFAPSELLKITHNALRCVKMYSIGGSELLMAYVLGRYMSFLSAMKIGLTFNGAREKSKQCE